MNHNVNCRNFVRDMIQKGWHFQDIYLDRFRMPDSYMINMLKDGFFKNLVLMGKSAILRRNQTKCPKIYLPFIPHIFLSIHHDTEITELYNVSYLYVDELDLSDHLLHKATASIGYQKMIKHYNLSIDGQEQYCKTSRKKIVNYEPGLKVRADERIDLLNKIGDVDKIRFIVLTLKNSIIHNIDKTVGLYDGIPLNRNPSYIEFYQNI